jgi:hypothetical protein
MVVEKRNTSGRSVGEDEFATADKYRRSRWERVENFVNG